VRVEQRLHLDRRRAAQPIVFISGVGRFADPPSTAPRPRARPRDDVRFAWKLKDKEIVGEPLHRAVSNNRASGCGLRRGRAYARRRAEYETGGAANDAFQGGADE
jgi:hypothetical protein